MFEEQTVIYKNVLFLLEEQRLHLYTCVIRKDQFSALKHKHYASKICTVVIYRKGMSMTLDIHRISQSVLPRDKSIAPSRGCGMSCGTEPRRTRVPSSGSLDQNSILIHSDGWSEHIVSFSGVLGGWWAAHLWLIRWKMGWVPHICCYDAFNGMYQEGKCFRMWEAWPGWLSVLMSLLAIPLYVGRTLGVGICIPSFLFMIWFPQT